MSGAGDYDLRLKAILARKVDDLQDYHDHTRDLYSLTRDLLDRIRELEGFDLPPSAVVDPAEDRVRALVTQVAGMKGVVERVASGGLTYDEQGSACFFCGFSSDAYVGEEDADHDPGCLVPLARAMVGAPAPEATRCGRVL